MSIHANIVKASNGESTILAGTNKEYFLPTHKDESRLRQIDMVGRHVDAIQEGFKCLKLLPMFKIFLDVSTPATGTKEMVDIIDNFAGPKGYNWRICARHIKSLHGP